MRLSFAVRPPDRVLATLAELPRPHLEQVLWSHPEQWIVKLRPLGHVPSHLQEPLVEAVRAELDGASAVRARLGPVTRRLAGQWLGAPVAGLHDLAAAVFTATEPLVPVTHPQPFQADVVLARGRVPQHLAGVPLTSEWIVTEVLLVADRSAPGRPRLDNLAAIGLAQRTARVEEA